MSPNGCARPPMSASASPATPTSTARVNTIWPSATGAQQRCEIVAHRCCAPVAEGQIVFTRAVLVGVAGDADADIGGLAHPFGDMLQHRHRLGTEPGLVLVEI